MRSFIVGSEGMGKWAKPLIEYIIVLSFGEVDIVWSNEVQPDLIVRSHYFKQEPELPYKAPYITWSAESYEVPLRTYVPILEIQSFRSWDFRALSAFGIKGRKIWLPYAAYYAASRWDGIRRQTPLEQRYLVGCCISNRNSEFRERVLRGLMQVGCDRVVNFASGDTEGVDVGTWFGDQKLIDAYRSCRFVLAMENKERNGYLTEKIVNAFVSGAVPVVYADHYSVESLFNRSAVINVRNFSSGEDLYRHLVELDANSDRYDEVVRQAIFSSRAEISMFRFSLEKPAACYLKMSDILQSALSERGHV